MGRVGGCQGQAHAYPVGMAEEGLSLSFLDSRRPSPLVLRVVRQRHVPNLRSEMRLYALAYRDVKLSHERG